jgi:hypothetical protein
LGYTPSASAAAAPTPYDNLTQQGRLLDQTGAQIHGNQLQFTFTLYDAATSGNILWTENQNITPDKGYFSAKLGDVKAIPAAIFDGTKSLFLGITIGTDTEMSPREAITAVPFALRAREADHATSAATTPEATHALNADNATKAATAGSATSATTANEATHAKNADNATLAAGVSTIQNLFSAGTVTTGTTTSTAACAAGTVATGGGCSGSGQALSVATFTGAKGSTTPTGYQCSCPSCTSLSAQAACVK